MFLFIRVFSRTLITTAKSKNSSLLIPQLAANLGPLFQSIVSLTSSLRVISSVLADSIHNILIFFAKKM